MSYSKEFHQERIKFFDSIAKYFFTVFILISSSLGGILLVKEKLSDLYVKSIFAFGIIIATILFISMLILLNKIYYEIDKLK